MAYTAFFQIDPMKKKIIKLNGIFIGMFYFDGNKYQFYHEIVQLK